MATLRKLRGRWQAQVRRRGMKPRCKSFDTKIEAEKWARDLEAQVDRFGAAPDTKILESTTLGQLLERYQREVSPLKRGSVQEIQRIDVLRRHEFACRTMIGLSPRDIASFRDERSYENWLDEGGGSSRCHWMRWSKNHSVPGVLRLQEDTTDRDSASRRRIDFLQGPIWIVDAQLRC